MLNINVDSRWVKHPMLSVLSNHADYYPTASNLSYLYQFVVDEKKIERNQMKFLMIIVHNRKLFKHHHQNKHHRLVHFVVLKSQII